MAIGRFKTGFIAKDPKAVAARISEEHPVSVVGNSQYTVELIAISKIYFNPSNTVFRKYDTDEDIAIFADGFTKKEDLHYPVLLSKKEDGRYMLLAGEKRTKAFMHKGWDTIPAFVYENLTEDEETIILYTDNLEHRQLTKEQFFLAFNELIEYMKSRRDLYPLTSDIHAELSKRLNLTQRTIRRYSQLNNAADEADILLLKNGKISYEEFREKTRKRIEENRSFEFKAKNTMGSVSPKKTDYYDKATEKRYYVDVVPQSDGSEFWGTYTEGSNRQTLRLENIDLPNRHEKDQAQADLDLFAAIRRFDVFSDSFRNNNFKVPVSVNSSGKSSDMNDDDESEDVMTFDNFDDDFYEEPEHIESAKKQEEFDVEKFDIVDIDDNKELNNTETRTSDCSPLCDFTALTYSGKEVRGFLFVGANGRVFLINDMKYLSTVSEGVFRGECINIEIDPKTLKRHDIYDKS